MPRDPAPVVAARARISLGLMTIAQLDALGVTRQQRRTLVAGGVLLPVHRRVLRHAAHPASWPQTALAGVLAAGDGAVASHTTAAALWRLDGVAQGDVVHVSVPSGRQVRPLAGVAVHRSGDLVAADVEGRRTVPCTTPARTLIDIAPMVTPRGLEAALDDAERRGLVWRPHLRWRVGELRGRGRAGAGQVARLLDRTEGRPLGDSWLEQAAIRAIVGAGLPAPRCQVGLRPAGGRVARVDLLWDDARLVVELDGHADHATRRRRQADAERSARLGLLGWHTVRFTYEDVVERPGHLVAMIRAYLSRTASA